MNRLREVNGPATFFEDKISRIPTAERLKSHLREIEINQLSGLTFASAPRRFSELLPNDEVLARTLENELTKLGVAGQMPVSEEMLLAMNLNPSLFAEAIAAGVSIQGFIENYVQSVQKSIGFSQRWYHQSEEEGTTREELVEDSAATGAHLMLRIMAEKGWDKLDGLIVTSALLPLGMDEAVLEKAGIKSERSSENRVFCAGGALALLQALRDFEGAERVIILGLDPLTFLSQARHYSLEHIAVPTTFGNDFVGVGLSPKDYVLYPGHQVKVIPDGGVILVDDLYQSQLGETDTSAIPDYLDVTAPGAAEMTVVNRQGIFTATSQPADGMKAYMNGRETGVFFRNHSPQFIEGLIQASGVQPAAIHSHEPSRAVLEGIVKYAQRKNLHFDELPFLGPVSGGANSSSTTLLRQMAYSAKIGRVKDDATQLVFAPGISAVFAGFIFEQKKAS